MATQGQRGFTLIELLVVVAVLAILTAIAIPLYANMQTRARIAKAQADARSIMTAVSVFAAHCGALPAIGVTMQNDCSDTTAAPGAGAAPTAVLRAQTNTQGATAGPFLNAMPNLPPSWTGSGGAYKYSVAASLSFMVCAAGDGTMVDSNGGTSCP